MAKLEESRYRLLGIGSSKTFLNLHKLEEGRQRLL